MSYGTFQEFFEAVVRPMKAANPDHLRLDGRRSGGTWDVTGGFRHAGRTWRLHADSRHEPLTLAYEALAADPSRDPFVQKPTSSGMRLDLVDDLQRGRGTRYRHLYAYSDD